jgi:hybrid cluster-associated redox disulfide protein
MGPKEVEILTNFGMGCIGCPSSQNESIEDAAAVHGINVENLLQSLNNIALWEKIKWKIEKKLVDAIKLRYKIK